MVWHRWFRFRGEPIYSLRKQNPGAFFLHFPLSPSRFLSLSHSPPQTEQRGPCRAKLPLSTVGLFYEQIPLSAQASWSLCQEGIDRCRLQCVHQWELYNAVKNTRGFLVLKGGLLQKLDETQARWPQRIVLIFTLPVRIFYIMLANTFLWNSRPGFDIQPLLLMWKFHWVYRRINVWLNLRKPHDIFSIQMSKTCFNYPSHVS